MDQALSNKEEPLFQILNVDPDRDQLDMRRRCPFIGLGYDSEIVMAFPTQRNHCHRVKSAQPVRIDYQSTHCLTFTHRYCPVLVKKSPRSLPSEIAVVPAKRRSTFVVFSFTITFILITIGLLLFSGWQWTSASDWFSNPDIAPVQQEVIEVPEQASPAESAPVVRPTEALPATELLLNDVPAGNLPEPTPTSIPSSET